MALPDERRMMLLVDENVPKSVSEYLRERGHEVVLVVDAFLPSPPDPVVAAVGDRHSAIVVSWDKDFDSLASRIPKGNKTRFRRLGRITFKCKEHHGRARVEHEIEMIELHYMRCRQRPDRRMFVEILGNALKLF